MRRWTKLERTTQSQLIREWKPWIRSTGPTTPAGKAKASLNAQKHGLYGAEFRRCRRTLMEQAKLLRMLVIQGRHPQSV